MRLPLCLALFLTALPLFAQGPSQSEEPPLADPSVVPAVGSFATDEAPPIRPVQGISPAPVAGGTRATPIVITGTPVYGSELPTPAVSLDVEGNGTIATGQPVVYKLYVRNNSAAKAHNVVVKVVPPKGASKLKAEPAPTHDEAETRWEFKTLNPGQSKVIELAYTPNPTATEVKLQARVQFDFGRGMVTKISQPALRVNQDAPETMV